MWIVIIVMIAYIWCKNMNEFVCGKLWIFISSVKFKSSDNLKFFSYDENSTSLVNYSTSWRREWDSLSANLKVSKRELGCFKWGFCSDAFISVQLICIHRVENMLNVNRKAISPFLHEPQRTRDYRQRLQDVIECRLRAWNRIYESSMDFPWDFHTRNKKSKVSRKRKIYTGIIDVSEFCEW